ncbi:metal ABC transporter substrate-binding protein [Streptomyces sp. NBRC 109706]|uniref:metal ABC transporter substrate-binding protein n=1 Tax=Streptomyces sp. NBRC 109706 TaxID=1550035 RepID=UPI000AC2B446|nr:metal ABC transporter substrate-binding protein [Streptomyces sp. NBRC 109706]
MTGRRRSRARIAPAALTVAALLTLTSCGLFDDGGGDGDDNGGGGSSEGPLNVVASFYPMTFLIERIGGEHVSVNTLTGPGVEPHDLDISPQQTAEVADAALVVYLKGLQPAVDEAIEQSATGQIAEISNFTPLEILDWTEVEQEEEHEGEHGEEGHEDEHDHSHEDEHDHDHGAHEGHDIEGRDPHVWLDPVKYAQVAQGVSAALSNADPENMEVYDAATQELVAELHALDEEFSEGLADVETNTFITTHQAFGYLAARYGLQEESITGLDPESEPSAARMRELREIAEENGVTTVFFETLVSDATARTLADDLGLATAVLDPVEGITDDSPGADYIEVMRHNLGALREALGAA